MSSIIVSNNALEVCNAISNPAYNSTFHRIGRLTLNKKARIGDVDNDGYISYNDAELIESWALRFDMGEFGNIWSPGARQILMMAMYDYYSPASVEDMDVNGDKRVNLADAAIIKRYIVDTWTYEREQGHGVPEYRMDY